MSYILRLTCIGFTLGGCVQLYADTIQLELNTPYVDRVMGATARVIPSIDLGRTGKALLPVGALALYFVYNSTQEEIAKWPLLMPIRNVIGGVVSKDKVPKTVDKVTMTEYGLPAYVKPYKPLLKIEDGKALLTVSLAGLFKDQLFSDAKAFRAWLGEQIRIIREELYGIYKISDDKPLTSKERYLLIHYLLKRTQCKHHATIYEDILHEMTEGCTSKEIRHIIAECVHYDEQALAQAAAYFGGMVLMHKLLKPHMNVSATICPVNCASEGIKVGKITAHDSSPLLTRTTPECRINESMIQIAGKVAAELTHVPLSTVLRNECKKNVTSTIKECGETDKGRKSLREKIEAEVRKNLEDHRPELDAIILILKKEWSISNAILDELLLPTQA